MQKLQVSWDKDEAVVIQRRKGNRTRAEKTAENPAALSPKKRST